MWKTKRQSKAGKFLKIKLFLLKPEIMKGTNNLPELGLELATPAAAAPSS